MTDLGLALDFLLSQPAEGLVWLFWFTLAFEAPRYALGFLALALASAAARAGGAARAEADPSEADGAGRGGRSRRPTVSVTVVGHNEADALERCLRSLREQTLAPDEVVVVSDGSSDAMAAVAARLVALGLADRALATGLRGGKSAGFNLAAGACRGEVVVNVDCDCSYDRFALENITAPFADPRVGAVCGDIAPRNGGASLVARLQAIEYLVSISVGKRVSASLGQVSCVSGAFGAFRRAALAGVGGADVGGGEDLDLTLRLRAAGWRVAFAPGALCYTDVPARFWALARQRMRWERDAVRLRLRKHRRALTGPGRRGGVAEAVHHWDFVVFEVCATAVFPLYLVWLASLYGAMAVPILLAMQAGLLVLDAATLSLAALAVPRAVPPGHLAFLPAYSVYSSWVMRPVRLLAHLEEWFLFGSRRDGYVPASVRLVRKW